MKKHRILGLGLTLVLVLAGAIVPGCEPLHHNLRPASGTDPSRGDESKAEEPNETKGFFKSTRLPGALSSEAREIEQSLGVR
jgi:hypothetical protein